MKYAVSLIPYIAGKSSGVMALVPTSWMIMVTSSVTFRRNSLAKWI